MKKLILAMTILISASALNAQKFGASPEDSLECIKNLSLYQDYYRQKQYDESLKYWKNVFTYCPKVSKGIYAGLTGPTLETPAEYQYVHNIGADAVGMSTVPEVIVARHMSIPCFAISIITDLGVPGKIKKVTHQEVIEVAAKQEPKMTLIMKELISSI